MRSYANVVATLALFLVVAGGTAFAATNLAQNSVGTPQLKSSAVSTSKLKDGAVTAAKIQPGTLAQLTATPAPKCPAGTVLAAGLCFETKPQAPTTFIGAMEACGRAGRVLPTQSQYVSFAIKNLTTVPAWEWVGQVLINAHELPEGLLMKASTNGVFGFTHASSDDQYAFRCAVAPS